MRLSLEEMRCLLTNQSLELRALHHKLERRTAILSPTKSFSTEAYHQSYISACTSSIFLNVFIFFNLLSHTLFLQIHIQAQRSSQPLFLHHPISSPPHLIICT